jgi:hypothetical protein
MYEEMILQMWLGISNYTDAIFQEVVLDIITEQICAVVRLITHLPCNMFLCSSSTIHHAPYIKVPVHPLSSRAVVQFAVTQRGGEDCGRWWILIEQEKPTEQNRVFVLPLLKMFESRLGHWIFFFSLRNPTPWRRMEEWMYRSIFSWPPQ